MARLICSSLARRLTTAFFAAVVLVFSAALVGDDAGHLRAELPDRPALLPVRGFYMPSYDVDALVDESAPSASQAVLAVHVRVPRGTRSNTVARDSISGNPGRPHRHARSLSRGLAPKPESA